MHKTKKKRNTLQRGSGRTSSYRRYNKHRSRKSRNYKPIKMKHMIGEAIRYKNVIEQKYSSTYTFNIKIINSNTTTQYNIVLESVDGTTAGTCIIMVLHENDFYSYVRKNPIEPQYVIKVRDIVIENDFRDKGLGTDLFLYSILTAYIESPYNIKYILLEDAISGKTHLNTKGYWTKFGFVHKGLVQLPNSGTVLKNIDADENKIQTIQHLMTIMQKYYPTVISNASAP